MKNYNCPNCGAPIGYTEICQYCGTRLNWIPFTAVKVEICPRKIIPLKSIITVPFEAKALFNASEYSNAVRNELVKRLSGDIPQFMDVISSDLPSICATEYQARLLICK